MVSDINRLCRCVLKDHIPAHENKHLPRPTLDQLAGILIGSLRSAANKPDTLRSYAHLCNLGLTLGGRRAEDPSVHVQYRDMFNELLFGRTFDVRRCPVRFISRNSTEWHVLSPLENHTHSESRKAINSIGILESHIIIYEDPDRTCNALQRLRLYLGQILHQMIHSYVNLHICCCRACTRDLHASDPLSRGGTRHDTFFLKISRSFQIFLKEEVGLKLTLDRHNAVIAEMKSSGAQVPDDHLRSLGFNPDFVRAKVQEENITCHLSDEEYTDAEYSETEYK